MVGQFQSWLVKIGSKRFLLIWLEKHFLSFKLLTTDTQGKSCLPNWFTIFHMVIEEMQSPAEFVRQRTSIDYCKMFDFFFWLVFLLSSPPSLTSMRFSHSSSMNKSLCESSKFPMSSISIPSSPSSTITIFSDGLSSSMKTRDF